MNKKSYSFDMETFRNMLLICPKLPGQKFVDPPFEEEILTFIRELGYPRNIKLISDVKVDTLPQPWRTFGTIINKCPRWTKTNEAPKPSLWLKEQKQHDEAKHNFASLNPSGAHEGTGVSPVVPDAPTCQSDDEEKSWKSSDEDDDDKDEEDSFDPRVQTPSHVESTDDEDSDDVIQDANVEGDMINEEETREEVEANVLYWDVNVNLEGRDTVITDALLPNVQETQETEDTHVILIASINPEGQHQSSFVSSGFVSNMLNPRPDTSIDSIFNLNIEATSLICFGHHY
ncbi:hypothetical protein Tco_1367709 [Tanacetum coccineum]